MSSAAASPGILARLKAAMFFPLPEEDQADFERAATFTNYPRAGIFALVVGGMNLLLGVIPDLLVWRAQGRWALNSAYVWWFALHATLAIFPAIFLPLLHRFRPARPADITTIHRSLVTAYSWITVMGMMALSLVHQRITGTITVYLLGVAGYSTAFYTSARASLLLLSVSVIAFSVALPFFQPEGVTSYSHIVMAVDLVAFFWPLSRVLYSLKARDFMQLKIIERQSAQLAAANRELAAANTELARADRIKTELLGLAAHDLRDPLNTIALGAQSLRDELPAAGRELVAAISDSARHMSALIDNLLIETESESAGIVLDRQPTNLPRLVADAVEAARPLASVKSITLHFSADDAVLRAPPAQVDPGRFRQIVSNLLSNAVKFSDPHRHVWITLGHDRADGYQLVVRDEGPGFAAEDQLRLFTKYQRGTARPTGGETSTGLGLAIVRQLVTLHHGRVVAESPGPGQGARFIVTVP